MPRQLYNVAIHNGNVAVASVLLDHDANVNADDEVSFSAITIVFVVAVN